MGMAHISLLRDLFEMGTGYETGVSGSACQSCKDGPLEGPAPASSYEAVGQCPILWATDQILFFDSRVMYSSKLSLA